MKRYLTYFGYVCRHKLWVAIAGLKLGVSWWRLLKHDWHKFLPSEFGPYARTFYNPDGSKKPYHATNEFRMAWNFHQKRADHHWQHHLKFGPGICGNSRPLGTCPAGSDDILIWDRGTAECLKCGSNVAIEEFTAMEMPSEAVREMVADWYGAGRAITGRWDAREWYEKNADIIKLHTNTKALVLLNFRVHNSEFK